jgi:hypothetical protein
MKQEKKKENEAKRKSGNRKGMTESDNLTEMTGKSYKRAKTQGEQFTETDITEF